MRRNHRAEAVLSTNCPMPSGATEPDLSRPHAAASGSSRGASERGHLARGALLGLLMLIGASVQAHAATLTVTSLADDGSPGTLRSRINAAAVGDTINFSVTGTIALTNGAIGIANDLTITGPGPGGLTVSIAAGGDADSILSISSGTVTISGITLSNGKGTDFVVQNPATGLMGHERFGGAIYMTGGTLALTNTTLSNNDTVNGGAIYATGGSLVLSNSTVSNNTAASGGGGIAIRGGSLAVTASTISGNSAPSAFGGGIYNGGASVTLTDSTISGNTAGGASNSAGGGIFNSTGTMTVTHCTISGNRATGITSTTIPGGGGIATYDTLTVANSTITGNSGNYGGGLKNNGGTLNLFNTIVAGNTVYSGSGPDIYGPVNSGDYNLVQSATDDTQLPHDNNLPGTHNVLGQPALLGPLANNGGPTLTHALLAGSPAFDAGDPTFNAAAHPYDQRGSGFPRVRDGRIEIGAYESEHFQSSSSLIVNTLADHDDGMCGTDDCTLREAVRYAASGATITFSVTGTITLTSGELLLAANVTISGPPAQGITISGNNTTRIFTGTGRALSLSNLTLTGGNGAGSLTSGAGGAIFLSVGTLTLNNCTVTGNTAASGTGNGGAINVSGPLTVDSCTLTGNTAAGSNSNGGAIFSSGMATVRNSTFANNTANGNSGALRTSGIVTVSNCTFAGNRALGLSRRFGRRGWRNAHRRLKRAPTTINNSTFSGNSAGSGGGIYSTASTLNLSNTIVAGNSAPGSPEIFGP